MNRRECLAFLSALLALPQIDRAFANEVGNFEYIYSDPVMRSEFFDFLSNVFHLFPEQDFHDVLIQLTQPGATDKSIYEGLQQELESIRPFLASLRYAIPALRKQKAIMADQTVMLLDPERRYDGHLEIGSTGRYVGILEDRLEITGDIFLLHTAEAGYGPEDIAERGQLTKIGTHIDMGNYSTQFANIIPKNSLDLVTVYIGFHHCPLDQRLNFIASVRDVIKPGGKMILRDHDVHDEDMWRMAALAHDTFNAGTSESWQFNHNELRNFYSLRFIIDYLEDVGLKHDGQLYFQRGDPTRNGLTAFTKD